MHLIKERLEIECHGSGLRTRRPDQKKGEGVGGESEMLEEGTNVAEGLCPKKGVWNSPNPINAGISSA